MLKIYIALIMTIAAFGSGYNVAKWRLTAQFEAANVEALKASAELVETEIKNHQVKETELETVRIKTYKELQNEQAKTKAMRDCIVSGSCGVRITSPSLCEPASQTNPEQPTSSVGDARAETNITTLAQNYLDLREQIVQTEEVLKACQSELRVR